MLFFAVNIRGGDAVIVGIRRKSDRCVFLQNSWRGRRVREGDKTRGYLTAGISNLRRD